MKASVWKLCIALILSATLAGCAWLFPENVIDEQMSADLPRIPYAVEWEGNIPDTLAAYLKEISLLVKLEHRPPTSQTAMIYRAKEDMQRLVQGMHAKGYFDGIAEYHITEGNPQTVHIQILPGTRYRLRGLEVRMAGEKYTVGKFVPSQLKKYLATSPGDCVDLEELTEDAESLGRFLRNHGFPFSKVKEPQAILDQQAKEATIYLRFETGNQANYGKTKINDVPGVDAQFIRNRIVWTEGTVYDEREVEGTRKDLMKTGIFSSVIAHPEGSRSSTEVPMEVHLKEGPPRTVAGGIKYSSTEGIGGKAHWSHANVFGGGQAFGVGLKVSRRIHQIRFSYDVPDIFAPRQSWSNVLAATQERAKAYFSRVVQATTKLEHPLSRKTTVSIGLQGEAGRVKREDTIFPERLVGLPLGLKADSTNDLLNPTKGGRLVLEVTPYHGRSGDKRHTFIPSILGGSYNWRSDKKATWVLAGWGRTGTILKSQLNSIVPNKRFYSGGGGSIRGYGYQMLGPLDANNIPTGGCSLLELGVEARYKVTKNIGLVGFVEGGSVTSRPTPSFKSSDRLWGVGVGARYYTQIGPIRLDLAFPMKRRGVPGYKKIDAPFQVYISIGQAF